MPELRVTYYHQIKGLGYGNIYWPAVKVENRRGRWTASHPCCPNGECRADDKMQFGQSESLARFRALGYYASCFPEGDGISMMAEDDKTAKEVAEDIAKVFGWRVTIMRDEKGGRNA